MNALSQKERSARGTNPVKKCKKCGKRWVRSKRHWVQPCGIPIVYQKNEPQVNPMIQELSKDEKKP